MKLHTRRTAVAPIALLAAASLAWADAKVETLPAAQVAAAEKYSVSIPESSTAEVIEAFKKQTGIALTVGNDGEQQRGGPIMLTSLSFKDLSLNAALDRLGRAVSMRVQFDGSSENPTIRLYEGGMGLSDQSLRNSGAEPLARVTYVNRNESSPPSPDYQQGLSLQVEVTPGVKPITGAMRVEVTEAIDDQGRALTTPQRERSPYFGSGGAVLRGNASTSVLLKYEQPRPARIKSLKGNVLLQTPKTIRRVTATDFADKAVSVDYGNGGKLIIGPAKPVGDRTEMKMRLERGQMPEAEWQKLNSFYNSAGAARFSTASGQALQSDGRGGSSGGTYYEVNMTLYIPREGPPSEAAAPTDRKPAKLVWDMVVETDEIAIPIEASDLPIP